MPRDAEPKRGRPTLEKSKRRDERLGVRLTTVERQKIEQLAEWAGKSVGAYLRDKGLAS